MVLEPLLWPFLSSPVFISVTLFFSTSLPPSQPPPQLFAVEPPTSSSHCPWVSDLQPPLLRSFTLHRPLPLASPLQTLLRLRFWSYHRDRLALIYKTVKASTPLETARATQSFCTVDHAFHVLSHTSRLRHALPRACTCQFSPVDVSPRGCHLPRQLLTSSLTKQLTLTVDFSSWLTFSVHVFLTQFFT